MSRTVKRNDLDFGSYDDDYRGFDMREDEGSRGPLILALALGVLLVFGAVVWNTYRQGVRPGSGTLPVITADAGDYKSVPDDRGGFEAPDLNKRIYDQLDGSDRDIIVASVPTNTVPEQLPPLNNSSDTILIGGPPVELRPSVAETTDPVAQQAESLAELSGRPEEIVGTQVASIAPTLPVPAPIIEAAATNLPVPQPRFAFDAAGTYMVQIAAFRSEEAAQRAWQTANASLPTLYAGADKHVQRADLGSKGIFYRLRAGSFAKRGDATAFCDALKVENQQCIVVH